MHALIEPFSDEDSNDIEYIPLKQTEEDKYIDESLFSEYDIDDDEFIQAIHKKTEFDKLDYDNGNGLGLDKMIGVEDENWQ